MGLNISGDAAMGMGCSSHGHAVAQAATIAPQRETEETAFATPLVGWTRRQKCGQGCRRWWQRSWQRQSFVRIAPSTHYHGSTTTAQAADNHTTQGGCSGSRDFSRSGPARKEAARGAASPPQGCRIAANCSQGPDPRAFYSQHAAGGQKPTCYGEPSQDGQAGNQSLGPRAGHFRARLADLCRPAFGPLGGTGQGQRPDITKIRRESPELGSTAPGGGPRTPTCRRQGCQSRGGRESDAGRTTGSYHRGTQGRTKRRTHSSQATTTSSAASIIIAFSHGTGPQENATTSSDRWWSTRQDGEGRQGQVGDDGQERGWAFAAPCLSPGPSLMGPPGLPQPSVSECLGDQFIGWMHSIVEDSGFVVPPLAQLLALQLCLQVQHPWWDNYLQDPRIEAPPPRHGFSTPDLCSTMGLVSDNLSQQRTLVGASRNMDRPPAVEPLAVQCCERHPRDSGHSCTTDPDDQTGSFLSGKFVHSCTDVVSPRHVKFSFSVEFWFPEAEQLELPASTRARKPLAKAVPSPSILRPVASSWLEGRIPSQAARCIAHSRPCAKHTVATMLTSNGHATECQHADLLEGCFPCGPSDIGTFSCQPSSFPVAHARPRTQSTPMLPTSLPFTSFDAVNGHKQLLGQTDWHEHDFILRAIEASGLPGAQRDVHFALWCQGFLLLTLSYCAVGTRMEDVPSSLTAATSMTRSMSSSCRLKPLSNRLS